MSKIIQANKEKEAKMDKRAIVVEIYTEDGSEDHYGMKITDFKRIDSFPEGAKIFEARKNELTATVSNSDFGDLTIEKDYGKMTDEDFKKEEKFIVSAWRYSCINESRFILEFDEDLYGKFVFITKMDKGAYLSVD